MNIDTSVPCGLITSELISNSLKYAFPDNRNGQINISLKKLDKQYVLTIADNGIGLPEDLDYKTMDSLGLKIVNSLVDQIDGEILLERNNGTTFKILFKELKYRERL